MAAGTVRMGRVNCIMMVTGRNLGKDIEEDDGKQKLRKLNEDGACRT
jgi:hypothetical protein